MQEHLEKQLTQRDSPPLHNIASGEPPSFFFGPEGLRAGWRLAIYVLAYHLLRTVFAGITTALTDSGQFTLWAFLVSETVLLAAAVVPAVCLAYMEERPFGAYGLPLRGAMARLLGSGVIWGLGAITSLLLIMRLAGVFHIEGTALHGVRVMKFAVFWVTMFLVVALYEDFLYRGYSQFTLAQGIGYWPAAVVLSAIFGDIHLANPGENWVGALGAGCIGLFFCLTLRRTGSLWFAIGMHAAWDWGETFLYSVPDSGVVAPGHLLRSSLEGPKWLTGGPVGPEGSVLLFVLIAILWVVFDRAYPAKHLQESNRESS
jgi:CAAX protease family protein